MSSQELAEWMAYDDINSVAAALVKDGVDARVAFETAWKDRSSE
jgi:hypothetical protein